MAYAFYVAKNKSALEEDEMVFIFDTITNLRESFVNNITKYPVAKSASKADHVQPQNNVITFTGIITENPIPNSLGNNDNSLNIVESEGTSRIETARRILINYRDDAETFSFINKYKVYKNCIIRNLVFDQTKENSQILTANITLEQIRVSEIETETDSVISDDLATETATGSSGKTETSDSYKSKFLEYWYDWFDDDDDSSSD